MPKLPILEPKGIIRILESSGFRFVRQKGSHRIYVRDNLRVTVPYHNKNLKPKTLKHIIKQSGLDIQNFYE